MGLLKICDFAEGIADRWGPFNTIHVGAAAGDEAATQKLLSLLSPGGRMVAPCGAPDTIQVGPTVLPPTLPFASP